MTREERTLKIVTKLYEAREAAKYMLGDKYDEAMRNWGEFLAESERKYDKGTLEISKALMEVTPDPTRQIILLAATGERIEHSADQPGGER